MLPSKSIVIVINLLTTVCGQYQELLLINQLNNFLSFDYNLFWLDSSVDIDRFIHKSTFRGYVPQTLYTFRNAKDESSVLETMNPIKSKNTFMIIAPQSSTFEKNLILLSRVKELQHFNANIKIGMFFSHIVSNDDLLKLFKWCWKYRIINIFAAFHSKQKLIDGRFLENSLKIFTFNPYETFVLIDLTGSDSVANIFRNKFLNLRQHPFRIALYDDPHSFIYSKDNPNFGGPDGKLWQVIFRILNASFSVVEFINVSDGHEIQQMVMNRTIDFAPQVFAINHTKPVNLYPVIDTGVIVVPDALPYPEFTGYMRAIMSGNLFGYVVVAILGLVFILSGL